MNLFRYINEINKNIIENNETINNAINESKINDIILSKCIKTTFEDLLGDNFNYGKNLEDIEYNFLTNEGFNKEEDDQEITNESCEIDFIKNKFLYIINIINKENYKFNQNVFKQEILKSISKALKVEKNNIFILSNNKRAFINYFIKTTNFANLSLRQIKLQYPNLKLLYEFKLLIDFFLRKKCEISKESFDFKYNFFTPNSSLNYRRGTEIYYPPYGWLGIGLNVNNKYDQMDNSWLNKVDATSKWASGYYFFGKNLNSDEIIIKLKNIIMKNDLYLDENFQIKMHYFNKRYNGQNIQRIGKGYYLCSDINVAEKNSGYIYFNNKRYKILLMAKVLIKSIKEPDDGSFWIIQNKEDIRTYRILLKEFY